MTLNTPPVGTVVQFFPGGAKDPHRQPIAAVVTEQGANGMVRLAGLLPGGGEMRSNSEFSRWIRDPWVADNLHTLRGGSGTMPRGAWDFVPAFTAADMQVLPWEAKQDEAMKDSDRREKNLDRANQKIREMLDAGDSRDAIVKKVCYYGFSKSEAQQLLDSLAMQTA